MPQNIFLYIYIYIIQTYKNPYIYAYTNLIHKIHKILQTLKYL